MAQAVEYIEVECPLHTVYNQWTQFEEFPKFMDGVEKVIQQDDAHLHWVATIVGQHREWDAEITEQKPDERIAWQSTSGSTNAGVVTFQEVDPEHTRVTIQYDFEPGDPIEGLGDTLGFVNRQVRKDLENFKKFIENHGHESGAWRGEIQGGEVK